MVVAYDRQGFYADTLIAAVDTFDVSRYAGFVYGSGFEAQPELLSRIAAKLPLIGNAPDAVAAVKTQTVFFAALQRLNINYPQVLNSLPDDQPGRYLMKYAGGSGGMHIFSASNNTALSENYYYQQKIDGCPVSLLFLANKHSIEVIDFNEQWLSPSADFPYRYGGAVGNAALPSSAKQQLMDAAQKLTQAFNLIGLNSLDAIVEAVSNRVFALEINPRLSATVDLYNHADQNLFEKHMQACSHQASLSQQYSYQPKPQCKAHAIVYAAAPISLSAPILWPVWTTDTPRPGPEVITISASEPVCSVFAYADTAGEAKKIAQDRVGIVQNLLQSLIQKTSGSKKG